MPCQEHRRCSTDAHFRVLGRVQPQLGEVLKTTVRTPLTFPQAWMEWWLRPIPCCDNETEVSGDREEEVSPIRHAQGGSMAWKDGRVWAKTRSQKRFSCWSVKTKGSEKGETTSTKLRKQAGAQRGTTLEIEFQNLNFKGNWEPLGSFTQLDAGVSSALYSIPLTVVGIGVEAGKSVAGRPIKRMTVIQGTGDAGLS